MGLHSRGMSFLNRKLENETQEVRYIRGASVCESLFAVPGNAAMELTTDSETVISAVRCRWTFEPNQLELDSEVVQPLAGDILEWELEDGRTLVFEVLPSSGEHVWFPVGVFGTRIGVWTKHIDTRTDE